MPDSRRDFFKLTGGAWLAARWPAILAAARHAAHDPQAAVAQTFEFLDAREAADVEALSAQIVPSGTTGGAREARVVHFIDRALVSFYADWASDFRAGLRQMQAAFRAFQPGAASFSGAPAGQQLAFLQTADQTPFFEAARTLTILGLLASPKYGGNYRDAGWKLIGFSDEHAFQPPFGYYDRDYGGFVPYGKDAKR
jgi:hypothetical protein